MIGVIYGTTGELIKLAPVLRKLAEDDVPFLQVTTAQQATQIAPFLASLGLPQPDVWLARGVRGRDLARPRDIPTWLAAVAAAFVRRRRTIMQRLRSDGTPPVVLVHGDTFTTVLGAIMGRLLRAEVAHVEAGLRSFDIRHPFPEELNRRITSRVATIHYAPGAWAAGNLKRPNVVDTGSNTVRDSLDIGIEARSREVPFEQFGIVSLHRTELLSNTDLLESTMAEVRRAADTLPVAFIDHPVTVSALERTTFSHLLEHPRIVRLPRLPYLEFIDLLRRSVYLWTDSGGGQEECFYLDHPCLVHRKRTERQEGLGETTVLSQFDVDRVRDFVANPAAHRRADALPHARPTDVIVTDLKTRGHVQRADRAAKVGA